MHTGVFAYHAKTGKLLWHAKIVPASSPIIVNKALYILGQDALYALDEQTGKVVWRQKNIKNSPFPLMPVDSIVYRDQLYIKNKMFLGGL